MNKLTDTLAKKAKIPYYKKTAYVLFAFALLVFIMTYFVLMIVLYRTQVQETNNLKSSLTSQYCSSVDLSLTSTIENLDTFALSEPIVDLVLRPPTSSHEQKIQILSSLKDFLKKMIASATCFCAFTPTVRYILPILRSVVSKGLTARGF